MAEDKKLGISGAGSRKAGGRVAVQGRRRNAKVADPEPDDQSLDITGGWEEDNGATFRVNQAGTHFEGWFVDYTTKQLTQVGGDFANGQAQVFDSPSGSRALGTLTANSSTQLTFASTMRSAAFNLRRIDTGAGLSDNAILAFRPEIRQRILDEQRRPLCTGDKQAIDRACSAGQIGPIIDEFHDLETPTNTVSKAQRAFVVRKVDDQFRNLFNTLNRKDHGTAEARCKVLLSSQTHTLSDGRKKSLLAWLYDMAPVASVLSNDPLPSLKLHLGINISSQLFHYKITLTLGALATTDLKSLVTQGVKGISLKPGLGGGVFEGFLAVEETDQADGNGNVLASFSLPVVIGTVGLGIGASVGASTGGTISTQFHWQEADFSGMVRMIDASIGIIRSIGLTAVMITGAGTFPELAVDCTGPGWVFGASAGIGEYIGFAGTQAKAQYTVPQDTRYTGVASAEQALHFRFGFATLTTEARQLLRMFAAQELAVLRSGNATLFLMGHADSVDTVAFNKLLSEARAFNVDQALKDILGSNYKIAEKHRIGLGESEAQKFDPPGTRNPVRRRVEINVNGRLTLELRGEQR